MKVILDITQNNRIPFFMEMVKSLDYITVIKEVKDEAKSQFVTDLADAFNDVKLFRSEERRVGKEC